MKGSDRPLRRRLVKLGFTIFAGRKRAHWQDRWPGLHIDHDATGAGRIMYRGRDAGALLPARLPPDMTEITVVGSGPSIRAQDLSHLAPGSAILLNGAIGLADQVAPLALAVEDERFIWRHGDMLARAPDCLWMLSPSVIRALLEQDAGILQGRRIVLIDNLLKPVHAPRRAADDPAIAGVVRRANGAAISLDPARGIMPAGTVAFSAAQFALAATPARLAFAGVDLSNANQPRFYETAEQSAASGIVAGIDRILAGFALLRDLALEKGVQPVTYSAVSALRGIGYEFEDRLTLRAP